MDTLTYVFGSSTQALAFRRGWTHGILAMAVLPAALAGGMAAWDRFIRRRRRPDAAPARYPALLLLAFLSILSHPLLDFLNTYGVRFLMPFSGRWFYGDTLFIVDPWLWLLLGAGVAGSRARERRGLRRPSGPAIAALVLSTLYVAVMMGGGLAGRRVAARQARALGLSVRRLMVGPVPWNALERMAVLDTGDGYRFGRLRLALRPALDLSPERWEKNAADPASLAAAKTPAGQAFLSWSRFPAFDSERAPGRIRVRLRDARYPGPVGSWASVTVTLPSPQSGAGPWPYARDYTFGWSRRPAMNVPAAVVLLVLALAAPEPVKTIRQIELRGNARILSADVPVRQGRLYLFHRYPDGVYMSVPAEDVLGIAVTKVGERPKTSDTVLLGPTGEGQSAENVANAAHGSGSAPAAADAYDEGYSGYYGPCYGCYNPAPRPPRPGPAPPALVGPNGFPLLPGSPPAPPIGPNGFPILAPKPQPSPR